METLSTTFDSIPHVAASHRHHAGIRSRYTPAEVRYLRNTLSTSSTIHRPVRHAPDAHISHEVGTSTHGEVVFAANPHHRVLYSTLSGELCHTRLEDASFFRSILPSGSVRHARGLLALNLYPVSDSDVRCNELLWNTVNRSQLDSTEINDVLGVNLMSVVVPRDLAAFLREVTMDELKVCIMEVLALIVDDGECDTIDLMKSELEESYATVLDAYLEERRQAKQACQGAKQKSRRRRRATSIPEKELATEQGTSIYSRFDQGRLYNYVEKLLRMCYLSPWKINTQATYITPSAMTSPLMRYWRGSPDNAGRVPSAARAGLSFRTMQNHRACLELDLMHVHSPRAPTARRALWGASCTAAAEGASCASGVGKALRRGAVSKTSVHWKLFQDWLLLHPLLVERLGVSPKDALVAVVDGAVGGTGEQAWEAMETVLLCATRPVGSGNLIGALPYELVRNVLAPRVLLAATRVGGKGR